MSRKRAVTLALVLLVGACATNPEISPRPAGFATDSETSPDDKMELQVLRSPNLGEVLADHEQYTLYRYDEDTTNPPKSNCVEPDCTLKWIPLLTAEMKTTTGIDAALLGVVERSNGTRQVTLNEHPLYRYAHDEKAGDATGDGLGGVWFAVAPNGEKARR
ncbi:hypothetical protein SK571_30550 [Lentzea sp. BCCO 10_0798]|uniref:Lipoprotein n=1 Tax=Lentzea kristufekii TaxID=3095430 RepID=A0ABU4TZJ0_9PSEU|nr:hypothetical protein [Lentzea sp. BCCO 10_0798]MDX8053734.1 hypothetical protein [Lentzea sp. BCCO 10_0798]